MTRIPVSPPSVRRLGIAVVDDVTGWNAAS
jgi:hypothetical protein